MWMFGDTFVGRANADGKIISDSRMLRNSVVIQRGRAMTTLYECADEYGDVTRGTWIPAGTSTNHDWYWPGNGVQEGRYIKVMLARFRTNDGGGYSFVGNRIALMRTSDQSIVSYHSVPNADSPIDWGTGQYRGAEHTYIFGTRSRSIGRDVFVQRVPVGKFVHGAREYWTGTGWSRIANYAAPITTGTCSQFSVLKTAVGYSLVTQAQFCGMAKDRGLYVRTAPKPWGPWSTACKIMDIADVVPGQLPYNTVAHPEFNDGGRVLFSSNYNKGFWAAAADVDTYRPRFFSVSAAKIANPGC